MKWRMLGKFLGVTFKDEPFEEKVKTEVKESSDFVFKDPGEYEHLSKQQKIELTKKMKLYHKRWSEKHKTIGKVDGR